MMQRGGTSGNVLGLVLLAAIVCGHATADNWPQWRGPNFNGSADEADLPTRWSQSRGVAWTTPLPGPSSSTPVVWGDRVFLVSADKSRTKLFGLCIDRDSGEVLWQKQFAQNARITSRNDMASSSPATDGKLVYFIFGTETLHAVDFDGNEKWSRDLRKELGGEIGPQFGYSSSPLLHEGRLYLPMLHGQWESGGSWDSFTDKDSYVLCIDAATGDTVWKVHRPTDGNGESFDSYASAMPYLEEGAEALVIQGADYMTGHDFETGEELWRQAHNPRQGRADRLIPSPVIAGDLVLGLQPRGLHAFAFNPQGQTNIAYDESTWIYEERTSDVATPLYYRDRIYIVNGVRKMMICLDPKTGEEIWREELDADSRIWASPTAGDGKIYCLTEKGQVVVVAASDKFEVLTRVNMGTTGAAKSSIAIADGSLYVRTTGRLHRITGSD